MSEYDLHCHSTCSDGADTPEALVRLAAAGGLAGIALTDHDTTLGVEPAMAEGRRLGVEVIPGVEITCEERAFECHLLGYWVDLDPECELQQLLANMRRSRTQRAREILRRLRALGVDITEAEVVQLHGPHAVGRPHIAAALVEKGYAPTVRLAMRRYLGKTSPAYVPRLRVTPEEGVAAIRASGGVAVYAHPGIVGLDPIIERLVPVGLAGLEAHYPEHTEADTARYAGMAHRLGLVVTGGSDYHGLRGSRHVPLGAVSVDRNVVEALAALRLQGMSRIPSPLGEDAIAVPESAVLGGRPAPGGCRLG